MQRPPDVIRIAKKDYFCDKCEHFRLLMVFRRNFIKHHAAPGTLHTKLFSFTN